MLETGVRQVRVATAMVFGRRLNVRAVERLVADALRTLEEFGSLGDDVDDLADGPFADPDERRDLQNRALQRTVRRLAKRSAFYRERLAGTDLDALTTETLRTIPVTRKADLIARPTDFLCSSPYLVTQTTGTTGRPVQIWLSRYEMELWPALIALSVVLRGDIRPGDRMQINLSSRATAAVQEDVEVCRLVNASCHVVGQVPPEESVEHLLGRDGDTRPTLLTGNPSYLARMVTAARDLGCKPDEFGLRSVYAGGEIMSRALTEALRETFGAETVGDNFGMTELLPVGGRTCSRRHLHIDPNQGYTEVLDLETGEPAGPGRLGELTVTPYYPYRECMPVLRYNTGDVVRTLDGDGEADCELAAVPAVSQILGKAGRLYRTADGVVTPRDVVEALDGTPGLPFPLRHRAATGDDGRLHVELASRELSAAEVTELLRAQGIDARVSVLPLDDAEAARRFPLRCDLLEHTFTRSHA
ncbi:phenylacetate--CoA ligase family protein [Streptomyces antimicrobicus]|uniref:AMP-binding protein n=1 Tax=Streptomyces antimicrobicus TaxID=2883108 RepID=A0ABS8BF77_9ACTN|nr:AMP-binding protein [Streptomyces antimicrobicus]MCB5183284.1 AMP-binding protein [Streptomyces antimicrobicus]